MSVFMRLCQGQVEKKFYVNSSLDFTKRTFRATEQWYVPTRFQCSEIAISNCNIGQKVQSTGWHNGNAMRNIYTYILRSRYFNFHTKRLIWCEILTFDTQGFSGNSEGGVI